MSYHHENIAWQTENGTWGIGFYERISNGDNSWDSDYDSEWDDDFNFEKFQWASTGHATEEKAMAAWRGANPGSSTAISWSKANAREILEYEDMAKATNNPAYALEREARKEKEKSAAFRKTVRDRIRKNPPFSGVRYSVRFSKSKLPSAYGMMEDITATLWTEGDWLVMKSEKVLKSGKKQAFDLKVWNTKTQTPAPSVVSIERSARSYY